jgi:glycosyltransferase involved in cell wall biosynthesis
MITYGITVADEFFEFKRLINSLEPYILPDEEIVILADKNKVTKEIEDFCELCGLEVNYFDFQKDFSEFKNALFELSTKDYLMQIDADEQIPPSLLNALRAVAKNMPEVDLVWIPRINVVRGATVEHIKKYNWKIDDMGWEGFPDFQSRFVSTKGHVKWQNKVHEVLTGATNPSKILEFPTENYSILHVKDIQKQEKQNDLYDTI